MQLKTALSEDLIEELVTRCVCFGDLRYLHAILAAGVDLKAAPLLYEIIEVADAYGDSANESQMFFKWREIVPNTIKMLTLIRTTGLDPRVLSTLRHPLPNDRQYSPIDTVRFFLAGNSNLKALLKFFEDWEKDF